MSREVLMISTDPSLKKPMLLVSSGGGGGGGDGERGGRG